MKSENIEGFTIEDLMGADMPFDNYSGYQFKFKTSKYRVTKVEFDLTAKSYFKSEICILNPEEVAEQEIELQANETKKVVLECCIEKDTGLFLISMGTTARNNMWLVQTKLSNLYIKAEKI